jgi:hypothetical protein
MYVPVAVKFPMHNPFCKPQNALNLSTQEGCLSIHSQSTTPSAQSENPFPEATRIRSGRKKKKRGHIESSVPVRKITSKQLC